MFNYKPNDKLGLSETCEVFSEFLRRVKEGKGEDLSEAGKKAVEQLRIEMRDFLIDDDFQKDINCDAIIERDSCTGKLNARQSSRSDKQKKLGRTKHKKVSISKPKANLVKNKKVKVSDSSDFSGSDSLTDETSSPSSCESSSTIPSSSSSNSSAIMKKKKKSRKKSKKSSYADNRNIPNLEKFREDSGQDLNKYLKKFEKYCEENYRRCHKDLWLNVLEDHLDGSIRETFILLRDPNDTYKEATGKLIDCFKGSSSIRKKEYRRKFERALPKRDESLFMFSIRLANLFKLAFPKHDLEKSSKLVDQFKASIPRQARDLIATQSMAYELKGKKARWSFIQKCVKLKDIQQETERTVNYQEDTPIMINLGQYPNNHGYRRSRTFNRHSPKQCNSRSMSQPTRWRSNSQGRSVNCYFC